ncbi:hypothetical protein AgCh_013608 [Apium graveolens]
MAEDQESIWLMVTLLIGLFHSEGKKFTLKISQMMRKKSVRLNRLIIEIDEDDGVVTMVEEFPDWIAEIDRFFEYMKTPMDKQEDTTEFMRLSEQNNLYETQGEQVARYLEGLKSFIRDRIRVQALRNLTEAKNMALKAEFLQQEKGRKGFENARNSNLWDKPKSFGENMGRFDRASSINNIVGEKLAGKKSMTETKEKDTQAQKIVNTYAKFMTRKCYRCNLPGHWSNECPQRNEVNMIAREADEDEEGYQYGPDGKDGEFEDYVEEETNLIVQKMMLTPKHEEKSQRHQLFHTRCTINRHIFTIVIDSGSMENIIDTIEITGRCKVPFSIGKYSDEIFCDVVDMDVCHLLFGRPLKYDVDAQHSGKMGNNPKLLRPLMSEFNEVMPEEVPDELPSMRDIQNCIDLIL